jgi:hypothetical protein
MTTTIWRSLAMAYNNQNYWVSGLCPSPGLQRFGNWICSRPQVREGGEEETHTLLGPLARAKLNHWITDNGNRSSFRNVVFSYIQNPGRWTKSRNPAIPKWRLSCKFQRPFEEAQASLTNMLWCKKSWRLTEGTPVGFHKMTFTIQLATKKGT